MPDTVLERAWRKLTGKKKTKKEEREAREAKERAKLQARERRSCMPNDMAPDMYSGAGEPTKSRDDEVIR